MSATAAANTFSASQRRVRTRSVLKSRTSFLKNELDVGIDYSREKKWRYAYQLSFYFQIKKFCRVKMSNKFAEQAKRKNIDEKSNCLHCKERSEIANQKRVAHFIASEIVSFWKKVSKVANVVVLSRTF